MLDLGPSKGAGRRRSAPATRLLVPVCSRLGHGSGRLGQLLGGLVEVEEGLIGLAAGLNPELAAAGPNGTGGRLGRGLGGPSHRGEGQQALYRRQGGEARLRASDARVPWSSSRRDRAGLGRRAGTGRSCGRTSGRDAGGR
jgi:hypothetical protein